MGIFIAVCRILLSIKTCKFITCFISLFILGSGFAGAGIGDCIV